jgi:acetyl-CoA C-acetyltransferase
MRKVCVIGADMTKFGKMEMSAREAAITTAINAIGKANLEPKDVGVIFISNCFGITESQAHLGPIISTALGIPDVPSMTIESACASSSAAFREGYVNVAGGFYDIAIVIGTEKLSHLDTLTATTYFAMGGDFSYESESGATFPGLYALIARAHMHKYGTTEEQLAAVAVKNHRNALHNPKAHFHKEITIDMVLNSMMVSYPLKLFDCCPFSDGAAAVVIATEEIAKKLVEDPIYVIGSARAGNTGALQNRDDLTTITSAVLAGKAAMKQAGVTPRDIDFAEVHDCFTIAEIVATEDLGFFTPGEGAKAAWEGETQLGGKMPINPSGGLKAKGHPVSATGCAQIVEVYEQLLGEAGKRQVAGAEIALCHNIGATGGSCSVHIFKR